MTGPQIDTAATVPVKIVRVVVCLLVLGGLAIVGQRSFVLWSRTTELKAKTAEVSRAVPADIRRTQLLDERFYEHVMIEERRHVSTDAILLLFFKESCPSCVESHASWRTALSKLAPPAFDVWLITYDGIEGAADTIALLARISASFRILKVKDPLEFEAFSGFLRVPLAAIVKDGEIACVVDGVAGPTAVERCLATITTRRPLYVERDPRGELPRQE